MENFIVIYQVCSYSFAVDEDWRLTIFKNGTYILSIKTSDTRVQKKQREDNSFGNWQMSGDTLKLEQTKFKSLNLSFLFKEKKLIPIDRNINILSREIALDYLEKTK